MWASLQRLRAAGPNPCELTSLVVDLEVDTRAGPAPLVLNRVYSSDPASKLAAAASLLGDPKAGFAMKLPLLPRALLAANTQPDARANWSASQLAWYQELVTQARDNGGLVREPGHTLEQRGTALKALFQLVDIDKIKQLWPQQELTSSWADLLLPPSAILQDRVRDVYHSVGADKAQVRVPEHTYRVRLCCPTAEVTYLVAGCIANYALLPRERPEEARRLRTILTGTDPHSPRSSASADTSTSETNSSDSDGEWHTYRPSRAAAHQRRRAASRGKQLAAFAAQDISHARFSEDSSRPLLQLASRVTMRSWQQRFVECFVSNWQSVGCRDHFAEDDPAFLRVITAVPELQDAATVRWHLRDQVGGTLVSLFIRDDLCEVLPKLNTLLRQVPELQHAALRVTCEGHPRRARGQRFAPSDKRRYLLTPEAAPFPRPAPATASSPYPTSSSLPGRGAPSVLPSWAAVLSAARPMNPQTPRRPSNAPSLDHRPHKEQRRELPVPRSAPTTAPGPARHGSAPPTSVPAPWEVRIAALEARLSGIQALCDALRDVPRMLSSIQHKLDLQMGTPSSLFTPPAPLQPIAVGPAPAPTPSFVGSSRHAGPFASATTSEITALSGRLDAQESMLDRILTQMDFLAHSVGGDVGSSPGARFHPQPAAAGLPTSPRS